MAGAYHSSLAFTITEARERVESSPYPEPRQHDKGYHRRPALPEGRGRSPSQRLMQPTPETTSSPRKAQRTSPRVRIDELSAVIRRPLPNGVELQIRPARPVTAAWEQALPLFEGWISSAELCFHARGLTDSPFTARLQIAGSPLGNPVTATLGEAGEGAAEAEGASKPPVPCSSFSLAFSVPLRLLRESAGSPVEVALVLTPVSSAARGRTISLIKLLLVPFREQGPHLSSLDLQESTDSILFDAAPRRLFDLQNPEEGIWAGTGKWRLCLFADWASPEGPGYLLDMKPAQVFHRYLQAGGPLIEDGSRRSGHERTSAELILDASHPALFPIPQEGKDIPLDLSVEHPLTFGAHAAVCTFSAALPIRIRDPRPLLKSFQRLSAVGIDFGTTATVAALYERGYRSLMRLGGGAGASAQSAENPTYLLVEDHERLFAEMDKRADGKRFPSLVRVVRGSHAAREAMGDAPSAVVGELKSLPERVINLDQSPQLRDRERQRDFLLDEARVRILIRTYAYLLSRAINRPGQDVYLHYWLTHPAKFDERSKRLLEEEIKNGILLGIPEGIGAEEITVEMSASEPEAFAAEVCPELAAHPVLQPIIEKFGEMRFAVFDFGGGTLDVACGRFRPATEAEQEETGSSTVIETLQVSGDDHLGGEYLTHELVWLTHQHERYLPEMEDKEVPMMRPQTVPPNPLVSKPHLYKRSLSARQNRFRFERELGLEAVKASPDKAPLAVTELTAARLDGSEVGLTSLGTDVPGLHRELKEHLAARVRDGVKLMKNMLSIAPWGGTGDFREQGVTLLLAGNSSRSGFVEAALGEELGIPGLSVWRPGSEGPFQQVVLYETPARTDRGATIVGVTPKTAVALGALKIANHEVHLVRRTQGFSYFLGDLRGFPPKFTALIPMGAPAADPAVFGPHYTDFGRWDPKTPLRVSREYVPSQMTSNDPRLSLIPTGLPLGERGRLFVCVVTPEEIALYLHREGSDPVCTTINLAKYMR